jgi:hypothetical protein
MIFPAIKAVIKFQAPNTTMATPDSEFLNAAFQLIGNTTIQGVFFGINCTLYFLCAQLLYRQYHKAPSDERRKLVFSFLYISVMMIMAAFELGANTRFMQLAYINHGGVHGEPQRFEGEVGATFSALRLLYTMPVFVIGTLNPLMQVSCSLPPSMHCYFSKFDLLINSYL